MPHRVTNDPCSYFGLDRKALLFRICVVCIFGVLQLSTCSAFSKQHMGLNHNRSPDLVSAQQWMWLCALAYWQLLLLRDVVKEDYQAWYPHSKRQRAKLTPYQ